MRPPWRRRSKKDPALVPYCGILIVVVCFAFCRSSSQEMGRRFLRIRGFHTGIPAGFSSCLRLLVYPKRNASTVLKIHLASTLSDIRDKARSIKNTPRKFPTWIDIKEMSRDARYMNAKFLKILRNILLATNFPAGILCSQSCPLRTFERFRSWPSCVNLKLSRSKLLGCYAYIFHKWYIFFGVINEIRPISASFMLKQREASFCYRLYIINKVLKLINQCFILCDKNYRTVSRIISSNVNFIIRSHSLWNARNIIFLFNKIQPCEIRQ